MKPIPPCKDCPERTMICHNPEVCAKWKTYLHEKTAYDIARAQEIEQLRVVAGYHKRVRQKYITALHARKG